MKFRRQLAGPTVSASGVAAGSPAAELASRQSLQVRPRRPMRLLAGAAVVVLAIAAGLALYSSMGEDTEVLVLTRTVLAGEQVTAADLRVVSVSSEDDLAWVPASRRGEVIGQYARYRLVQGGFVSAEAVQPGRLVTPGWVLMSVQVPAGEVPVGLRERSDVVLVVTGPGTDGVVSIVNAVVAAVPSNLTGALQASDQGGNDLMALSVEVPTEMVATVGTAASVSLGVVDPANPAPEETLETAGLAEPEAAPPVEPGPEPTEPAASEPPSAAVAPATTVVSTMAAPAVPVPTAAAPASADASQGAGG